MKARMMLIAVVVSAMSLSFAADAKAAPKYGKKEIHDRRDNAHRYEYRRDAARYRDARYEKDAHRRNVSAHFKKAKHHRKHHHHHNRRAVKIQNNYRSHGGDYYRR